MLLNLALAGAVLGFSGLLVSIHLVYGGRGKSLSWFSLSFMALALSQGKTRSMSPVAALPILPAPTTHTIIVMAKRIVHGQEPF